MKCTHLTCRLRVPLIIIASVSIITGIAVAVLGAALFFVL
jgi:hypothetical protein